MYRLRDADGNLLYVGCTIDLNQRVQYHARKLWGPSIAEVEAVLFPSRPEAAMAEHDAITREAPRHNVRTTADRLDAPCLYADVVMVMEESSTANLASVGDQLGITGERVRQILKEHGYDYPALGRERRALARDWREAQAIVKAQVRRERLPMCVVCEVEHRAGGGRKTCGPKCADALLQLRTTGDEHRIACAKSILRHPEGQTRSRIVWARRMLSDNPPPKNRQFSIPGSHRSAVLEEHRQSAGAA
jgi:hypothetical protein